MSSLKSQYEARIAKLQKDLEEAKGATAPIQPSSSSAAQAENTMDKLKTENSELKQKVRISSATSACRDQN